MSEQRNVLVTGAAGFIGMHVAARLLEGGSTVTGADNLDPYYDVVYVPCASTLRWRCFTTARSPT